MPELPTCVEWLHRRASQIGSDFLTQWKDADADIPIFKQAKAEYVELQSGTALRDPVEPGVSLPRYPEDMVSKLLDENTANIEKAKSLTAGLSAVQMNWRPQPGKWSIAQNLDHLNRGYRHFDTITSSIAAARAEGIIGNGPDTALSPQ
jgi:hypothetical protein